MTLEQNVDQKLGTKQSTIFTNRTSNNIVVSNASTSICSLTLNPGTWLIFVYGSTTNTNGYVFSNNTSLWRQLDRGYCYDFASTYTLNVYSGTSATQTYDIRIVAINLTNK